ncbi:MAG: hypothetical protein NC209_03880 [Alistipes sp.]|nr:hypothetical protein [Lachnospiraceae bacterium]MCM1250271.1 hypothetical protein [Alistipes sp.]
MSQYDAHNSNVFSAGLKRFAELQIKPKLLAMCKSVAQTIVDTIDGNFVAPEGSDQFPVWSSNLHDATGVGVYCDGALSAFIPTARATEAQTNGGETWIFGSELLQQAIANAATQFTSGIWIVLFSSVPYAYEVNTQGSPKGRGVGFFEALQETLLTDVLAGLKPIAL